MTWNIGLNFYRFIASIPNLSGKGKSPNSLKILRIFSDIHYCWVEKISDTKLPRSNLAA